VQGEGPAFYSEAKAQVRVGVPLPDRCGTVPVGRKISTVASMTGSFATATMRRPVPLGGKLGGKIVKRRPDGLAAVRLDQVHVGGGGGRALFGGLSGVG
jgi:hypothetical protein